MLKDPDNQSSPDPCLEQDSGSIGFGGGSLVGPGVGHDFNSAPDIQTQFNTVVNIGTANFPHIEEPAGLPNPEVLQGYEDLVPGSAAQILDLAKTEAEYRRELHRSIVTAEINDQISQRKETRLGQILGAVLVMSALVAGVIIALVAEEVWTQIFGVLLGGGGLTALALAFRYTRKDHHKSLSED